MNATLQRFLESLDHSWSFHATSRTELSCGEHRITVHPGINEELLSSVEIEWPYDSNPVSAIPTKKLCEAVLESPFFYPAFTERACPAVSISESYEEISNGWTIKASSTGRLLNLALIKSPEVGAME